MCKCLKYVEHIFGTKNTEKECVICLEKEQTLQHIDKYMHNRVCMCNYYVHENCFYTWRSSHYCHGNNEMNCLICNSIGNIYEREYKKNNMGIFEMAFFFLSHLSVTVAIEK